jgi:phosphoglycolate phosphatase
LRSPFSADAPADAVPPQLLPPVPSERPLPGLVCFDLDGCLVDSDAAIFDAINHALRLRGLRERDPAELRPCVGPPLVTSMRRLLAEDGVDVGLTVGERAVVRAVEDYRTRYREVGFDLTLPVEGVPAMLAALAARLGGTARIVVVTAKPTAVSEPLLTHVGLRDWFGAVHGVPLSPLVQEKAVTLAGALAERNLSGGDAVMIGDREHDVEAGRICGTRTIGVLWGAGERAELEAAGADRLAGHPSELEGILESLA